MKRIYSRFGNDEVHGLSVRFENHESYYPLVSFLVSEVDNFSHHIIPILESVVNQQVTSNSFGGNAVCIDIGPEVTEVYFNLFDDDMPEPCFVDTLTLYKLVLEWVEMKKLYKAGLLSFPIEKDGFDD